MQLTLQACFWHFSIKKMQFNEAFWNALFKVIKGHV